MAVLLLTTLKVSTDASHADRQWLLPWCCLYCSHWWLQLLHSAALHYKILPTVPSVLLEYVLCHDRVGPVPTPPTSVCGTGTRVEGIHWLVLTAAQWLLIPPAGVPYAVWGMAYIILFSKWLLPGDDAADDLNYGLLVTKKSSLAGKTAREAGFTGGKVLLNAIAKGRNQPAVPHTVETLIHEGDTLFVTGGRGAMHGAMMARWLTAVFLLSATSKISTVGNGSLPKVEWHGTGEPTSCFLAGGQGHHAPSWCRQYSMLRAMLAG